MSVYEKECPFEGDQSPAEVQSGPLRYARPAKCVGCVNFHEMRCKVITNRYLRLDYGFCGIEGSKELVDHPKAKRAIPAKCSTCQYLGEKPLYGLVCTKDEEAWGDIPRGLDY